ncbi:hypothetical protein [Mycolicibacterium neoaurum]|uniref:hypothetical protein n=1 Tax=Mycolicibacterium neoaurum TaxID=1795 RepID=UPI001F25E078|nr:hypothetical protein [Mycolicibacterium neoaurum]
MAPKNNERFARIVSEAFAALGVTQLKFQDMGGPSDTTLRKIMDGEKAGISPRTLSGLDSAFGWAPGSAARTLAGGNPTELSAGFTEAKRTFVSGRHVDVGLISSALGHLMPLINAAIAARDTEVLQLATRFNQQLSDLVADRAEEYAKGLNDGDSEADRETAATGASAEGRASEEAELVAYQVDESSTASIDTDIGTKANDTGVDGAKNGEKRHNLPGR